MTPVEQAVEVMQGVGTMDVIVLFSIITSVAGATWFLARDNEKTRTSLAELRRRLDVQEENNYTKPEAEAHALRLAIENPGLRVPDPKDTSKVIQVGNSRIEK